MLQTARVTAGILSPASSLLLILISYRAKISARVAREKGLVVIFLESLCDDPAVIAANVALKVSSGDPDYKNMSREEAERDFLERIRLYERVYETITEPNLSYFRILNVGNQVTLCNIHGYLQSRIAFYLMNLHIKPRSIFFSRVSRFLHIFYNVSQCGIFSMGRASLMFKGKLEETHLYLPKEENMHMPSPALFTIIWATHISLYVSTFAI